MFGGGPSAEPQIKFVSVGFCLLPETVMTSRPSDRRVGFFTTPISIAEPRQVPQTHRVVNRWNLDRRGGKIVFHIDPSTPAVYYDSIVQGVESWNSAFSAAGFKHNVVECIAPSHPDFPEDYDQGDARFSVVYLALSPRLPVLGFGPSIVDCRTGEIMRAHVLLGLEPMIRSASRSSFDALEGSNVTFTDRQPMLPADHPDVMKTIVSVVAHEIGHCIGLRHNFIAAEDGNSSVMEYTEDVDTTSNPLEPCYGALFLYEPGVYDIYAIKYGYTPLPGEQTGQRHPALALLANGQDAADNAGVAAVAMNPLFATDGSCETDSPSIGCARGRCWGARPPCRRAPAPLRSAATPL